MSNRYWSESSDIYQYPGSQVLKNIPNIQDEKTLEIFEQRITMLRAVDINQYIADLPLNLKLWQIIHKRLFQEIFEWAGEIRKVQLSKGNTVFAMPEFIASEADKLFIALNRTLSSHITHEDFIIKLSYYYGEMNVLHPFREGNGRTQKLLFDEIARRHGNYVIDWEKIDKDIMLEALILAYQKKDYTLLGRLFAEAIAKY